MGIALAIAASTCLNVGKGIQKWKVEVLAQRGRWLSPEHRRAFGTWLFGVGLTASASILYTFALKLTDKASTVTALNGLGLIGLVVFAWWVLEERIGWPELGGAALVIAGTVLMGALDEPVVQSDASVSGFVVSAGIGLGLFVPLGLYAWRARRFHGLVFGSAAGTLIGVAMILGDIALVGSGGDVIGQFAGPYVYAAIIVGLGALGITQLAFWRATAMVVVPTTNSFVILAPLPIQYFTFGTVLHPAQYLGIGIIVAGVVILTGLK